MPKKFCVFLCPTV